MACALCPFTSQTMDVRGVIVENGQIFLDLWAEDAMGDGHTAQVIKDVVH